MHVAGHHVSLAPLLLGLLVVPSSGCAHEGAAELEYRAAAAEALADGAVRLREDSLPFIEVQSVGDAQVPTLVRAPARLAFREGAASEVGAPTDGRVTEVHARVGERVELGDPLVTISSPSAASARGELARARLLLQAAQAELARQEQMRAAGVGIEAERVRAEGDVAQARAMLVALSASAASIGRGSAASVVVRAPIAGTVLSRRASVGLAVEAGGEPLLVVGDPSAVWIVAEVFERELPLISEGESASVVLASVGTPLAATVASVGGAVDPQTRRAPVYLALGGELPTSLRAGMYARVEIEVGDAGLGIPTSSVLVKDGGRTVVFVQRDARTFLAREVQVGPPVRGRAPVLAGLDRTDRIVTRGALLIDGQADLLR